MHTYLVALDSYLSLLTSRFKVRLFVTYSIIQDLISSEMSDQTRDPPVEYRSGFVSLVDLYSVHACFLLCHFPTV